VKAVLKFGVKVAYGRRDKRASSDSIHMQIDRLKFEIIEERNGAEIEELMTN
jgi:hypothetical protein